MADGVQEPERKLSSFKPQDLPGLEKALLVVEDNIKDYKKHGLSANHIWLGLINLVLSSAILGRMPENYWIFATIKGTVYMALAYSVKSSKSQILYFLDFCWIFAYCTIATGYMAIFDWFGLLGDYSGIVANQTAFVAFFSCATTLGLAVVLLGNAMVLHDAEHMSSLFIHISPPLLAWAFRWNSDQVQTAFPGIFGLYSNEEAASVSFMDMWEAFNTLYMAWFVPYLIWLLVWGRFQRIETTGRETAYLMTVKMFPSVLLNLLGVDAKDDATITTIRSSVLYMLMHWMIMQVTVVLSFGAWHSFYFNSALVLIALLSSSRNGSIRYYKMMTRYQTKAIETFISKTK